MTNLATTALVFAADFAGYVIKKDEVVDCVELPTKFVFVLHNDAEGTYMVCSFSKPSATKAADFGTATVEGLSRQQASNLMKVLAATGRPYLEVRAALERHGRKHGHGTYMNVQEAALRDFGFKLTYVPAQAFINAYPAPHNKVLKSVTTHHPDRFAGHWPAGTFLLYTTGHVLCVKDGVNHDWTRGSARRVRRIYVVEPL